MEMSMSVCREHRWLLLAVCAAQFLMPLIMAGVNAVLPAISLSLDASARELGLIGAFYALGLAVFQLAGGLWGDIWGRRRIFLVGLAIFSLSGALLGFVENMTLFLFLRLVQGLGGALYSASSLALLASAAPPSMRASYIGFSSSAVYSGIACGPPVAGFVADWFGWRWLFWGNAIAGGLALCIMLLRVRLEWRTAEGASFDWSGCVLYALAMTCLTFGASHIGDAPVWGMLLLAGFLALLGLFCFKELRTAMPMLDLKMLRRCRVISLSLLAAFINYASFFGLLFFVSIYLQTGRGFSAREAGLFLALQSLVQAAATPLTARLCRRWPLGRIAASGILLCGMGLLITAFLTLETPLWLLALAQALVGAGVAVFVLPNTAIILEKAGDAAVGRASGLIGAVRTGGQLSNMVIITVTLALVLGHQPVSRETLDGFMTALHWDLLLFGLFNLAAMGCALCRDRAGE